MGATVRWVSPAAWMALTGRSVDFVTTHVDKHWIEGIHYKRTGPRLLWLNIPAIDDWVERHVCVQTEKLQKGSKSAAAACE